MMGEASRAAATGEEVVGLVPRARGASVRCSVWTLTVALPPMAVMLALLHRRLPQPHRDVYLLGSIGVLVMPVIPV